MKNYDREPDMPGVFTYSSGDCRDHGVNVPFAAARGGSSPKLCVACMLVELQRCAPPASPQPPTESTSGGKRLGDYESWRQLRYGPGPGR